MSNSPPLVVDACWLALQPLLVQDAALQTLRAWIWALTGNASATTDDQRNNKYVMHNKVYYVLTPSGSSRDYVIALFDDEEPEDDKPIQESVGNRNTPWPCRVYDLQGRLISERESPETLLINHPSLQPGVYIFGDRKVIVK